MKKRDRPFPPGPIAVSLAKTERTRRLVATDRAWTQEVWIQEHEPLGVPHHTWAVMWEDGMQRRYTEWFDTLFDAIEWLTQEEGE